MALRFTIFGGLIKSPGVVFEELFSLMFLPHVLDGAGVAPGSELQQKRKITVIVKLVQSPPPPRPVCPAGSRGPCHWSGGISVIHHHLLHWLLLAKVG